MASGPSQKLRIVAVGDDLGFDLPPDIIERHQLRQGDDVHFRRDATGVHLIFKRPGSAAARAQNAPRDTD
jgi:hypothetical protein